MAESWTTTTGASTANETVWRGWNDYTDSTTGANSTVWATWNSGTTGSIAFNSPSPPSPSPETEEERQARLDRQQLLKEEREALQLKREEAQRKAQELLQESLDEEQLAQFEKTKWFFVIGQSGKRYRVRHGWAGNIDELNEQDEIVAEICIHPSVRCPVEDNMLIQKLMLEADEERLLQIGNRQSYSVPRPWAA